MEGFSNVQTVHITQLPAGSQMQKGHMNYKQMLGKPPAQNFFSYIGMDPE